MLSVSEHTVPWPELDAPVVVAQITDVHMGPSTPARTVRKAIEIAADKADILVFTGDAVNVFPFPAKRLAAMLAQVDLPKVGVLGNHDHLAGPRRISGWFEDAGMRMLHNQSLQLGDLTIVGLDDGKTRHADPEAAFAGVDEPRPTLVLAHYPMDADQIAPLGGRLILSGHTHGGQAQLPGTTLVSLWSGEAYIHGFYDVGEARLYVSAGLGHGPLRFGCPPELALFRLDPAAAVASSTQAPTTVRTR